MSRPGLEAWQISLIVTALVVLVEFAVSTVASRVRPRLPSQWRTALLVLLVILTTVVFVAALGPSLADELASVAAGIAAVAALWLTYRSYNSTREQRAAEKPAEPAAEAPAPEQPAPVTPAPEEPAPAPADAGQGPWAEWLRSRRKTRR